MDLNHYIGDDLSVSSTGDLMLVADTTEGQQRVLRRLLTNTDAYLWHGTYGAGVPGLVGETYDQKRIIGVIRSQIFNEDVVSRVPDPVINVSQITNGVSVQITYTDATSRKPVSLNFNVNK